MSTCGDYAVRIHQVCPKHSDTDRLGSLTVVLVPTDLDLHTHIPSIVPQFFHQNLSRQLFSCGLFWVKLLLVSFIHGNADCLKIPIKSHSKTDLVFTIRFLETLHLGLRLQSLNR